MVSRFLREELSRSIRSLYPDRSGVSFAVSPERRFGDYTTNAALALAGDGINARDAADEISAELKKSPAFSAKIKKVEIAGPGFINFSLSDEVIKEELANIKKNLSDGFDFLSGKKINIEFISANPTGELHIGHGRGAFYGDALANIFKFSGAEVTREYFINDSKESNQIKELGKTIFEKGAYSSDYINKIISKISPKERKISEMKKGVFSGGNELSFKEIGEEFGIIGERIEDIYYGAGFKIAGFIQEDNRKFIEKELGVNFDDWYSEEEKLHKALLPERILTALKTKELTYEKDRALWLKTSEHGDDEDRVVIRSDGTPTYFLSDIAYHSEKFSRGYDEVIDVWGADHHGHVKRIQAAKEMLSWKGDLKIFITQLVSLKDGKMSKRAGNVILLKDLVKELGLDVVRWFFSEKSLNTHMEFDMALAKERSAKNPVFYVQYAHARICSIIEKAKSSKEDKGEFEELIKNEKARSLAAKIIELPEIIQTIAEDCQVHRLTTYAYELANSFSQFYENVRIIGENSYNKSALELAGAAKETLAKSLGLLGISAPEKM